MHQVHENLLNKSSLPHTVVKWYVCRKRKSLLKEYGLSHTVAEWYIHCKHEVLLIKTEYSTHGNMCWAVWSTR